MHVHVIMHGLPHYITTPMHQCMFMVFKQSKNLNKHQRDKNKQTKTKQRGKDLKTHKLG